MKSKVKYFIILLVLLLTFGGCFLSFKDKAWSAPEDFSDVNLYPYSLGTTRLSIHDCDLDYTPNFRKLLDSKLVDMLDVDFFKTKDGVWVSCHKADVNKGPCAKANFNVTEKTYAEVCDLCYEGNKPMTFQEFCQYAIENDVLLQTESKYDDIDTKKDLLNIAKNCNALKYIVYSGSGEHDYLYDAMSVGYHKIMAWCCFCEIRQLIGGATEAEVDSWSLDLKERYEDGEVWVSTRKLDNPGLTEETEPVTPVMAKNYHTRGIKVEVGMNVPDVDFDTYLDIMNSYDINSLASIKMECAANTTDDGRDVGKPIREIFDAYDAVYGNTIELNCQAGGNTITGNTIYSIPPGSRVEFTTDADGTERISVTYNHRKDGSDGISGNDKVRIIEVKPKFDEGYVFDGWYYNNEKVTKDFYYNKQKDTYKIVARFKKINEVSFDNTSTQGHIVPAKSFDVELFSSVTPSRDSEGRGVLTFDNGENVVIAEPNADFIFAGWYANGIMLMDNLPFFISGNTKFSAKWVSPSEYEKHKFLYDLKDNVGNLMAPLNKNNQIG